MHADKSNTHPFDTKTKLPAQPFKEIVIRLLPQLYPFQKSHRRIWVYIVLYLDLVEIFGRDPAEYGSDFLEFRLAVFAETADKLCKSLVLSLGFLNEKPWESKQLYMHQVL